MDAGLVGGEGQGNLEREWTRVWSAEDGYAV
jgi:hypothetical protein